MTTLRPKSSSLMLFSARFLSTFCQPTKVRSTLKVRLRIIPTLPSKTSWCFAHQKSTLQVDYSTIATVRLYWRLLHEISALYISLWFNVYSRSDFFFTIVSTRAKNSWLANTARVIPVKYRDDDVTSSIIWRRPFSNLTDIYLSSAALWTIPWSWASSRLSVLEFSLWSLWVTIVVIAFPTSAGTPTTASRSAFWLMVFHPCSAHWAQLFDLIFLRYGMFRKGAKGIVWLRGGSNCFHPFSSLILTTVGKASSTSQTLLAVYASRHCGSGQRGWTSDAYDR